MQQKIRKFNCRAGGQGTALLSAGHEIGDRTLASIGIFIFVYKGFIGGIPKCYVIKFESFIFKTFQ